MKTFSNLSGRQTAWLVLTLTVAIAIVAVGWSRQEAAAPTTASEFTVEMSIKQIAPRLLPLSTSQTGWPTP